MSHITTWLDERRELGALFIRLFMSTFLIYMSQDNVFDRARMVEFERFLRQFGFPTPVLSAHVSVYAQLACGLLILLGAFTRVAAAVMVINFVVALVMVHTRLPFREALDPSAMLAGSLFLLFHGAGAPSIDAWRERRSTARLSRRPVVSYSR
jgi:putative oxidoreductase